MLQFVSKKKKSINNTIQSGKVLKNSDKNCYSENVERDFLTLFSFSHAKLSFQTEMLAEKHDYRKGFNSTKDPGKIKNKKIKQVLKGGLKSV